MIRLGAGYDCGQPKWSLRGGVMVAIVMIPASRTPEAVSYYSTDGVEIASGGKLL